jgi:hypothetical protein
MCPTMDEPQTRRPLGNALHATIARLRSELGDPFAPITILVPSNDAASLTKRSLAAVTSFLRVWSVSTNELIGACLPAAVFAEGKWVEPSSFKTSTIARALEQDPEALGSFSATVNQPGFFTPLATAAQLLEEGGCSSSTLADHPCADPSLDERRDLMQRVLALLEEARNVQSIFAPGELETAAIEHLAAACGVGPATAKAVIVLGDTTVSAPQFRFLQQFLSSRKVVRLVSPHQRHLGASPRGTWSAAPQAETVDIELADGALGAVQRNLGAERNGDAANVDDTLRFIQTPDEAREKREVVRIVQDAIGDGTPLARIAIVPTTNVHLGALDDALDQARIPVTWHVGRPLSRRPAAGLCRLFCQLAEEDQRVGKLHETLFSPAFTLRRRLGAQGADGRARWRRILSQLPYADGGENMVRALGDAAQQARLDAKSEELETTEQRDRARRHVKACETLLAATAAIFDDLKPLAQPQSFGDFTRRLFDLLADWGIESEGRRRVMNVLESSSGGGGEPLSLARNLLELEAVFERHEPQGHITDQAVKVLPPRSLVGGEFDLVVVLGLNEQRFPAPVREDPLVTDALMAHLNAAAEADGVQLLDSSEQVRIEQQRLSSCVAATTRSLVLSVPAEELDPERPLYESQFCYDLLGAALGRLATRQDYQAALEVRGSRAYPTTQTPERSLGGAEYLCARLTAGDEPALRSVVSHSGSSRLLRLLTSLSRVARGDAERDVYTGVIDPAVLSAPGLDGEPISDAALAQLLKVPTRFVFRYMLGAWPPPRLGRGHPLGRFRVQRNLFGYLEEAFVDESLQSATAIRDAVLSRFEQVLDDELSLDRGADPEQRAIVRSFAEGFVRSFLEREEKNIGMKLLEVTDGKLADDLPWRLRPFSARTLGADDGPTSLLFFDSWQPKNKSFHDSAVSVALRRIAADPFLPSLASLAVISEQATVIAKPDPMDQVLEDVRARTAEVAEGRFPLNYDKVFSLAGDGELPELTDDGALPEDGGPS